MPTVLVNRQVFFDYLKDNFSEERLDEICFEFGIEFEGTTSEKEIAKNEQNKENENLSDEVLFKIEVPANRYDLLCVEGLTQSLGVFLGTKPIPEYRLTNPLKLEEMTINESVLGVRPYVCCAILRDITFTTETIKGFMELQDKLHNNICRGRTLVSMGTHDLDSVSGPFTYCALKRDQFEFIPLNRSEKVNGDGLLAICSNDNKLKNYVYLLSNEEYFPAICDSNGLIMSIPPLINSEHSKIKLTTKNVFIEVTAKDSTKAKIVLNTLVAMFSMYCKFPFTVEQVQINAPTGNKLILPDITPRIMKAEKNYLNRISGLNLTVDEMASLLSKMGLKTTAFEDNIEVQVPITRSDILHPCDIAEDLAIAFGYNNISKTKPNTICNGYQQPINKLTDLIRLELALSGYTECLTMALISIKDMHTNMLNELNENSLSNYVQIYKSKTAEFELFRTSLIPGLLKTIEANKSNQLPYKIFEISDVVLIDTNNETGASNRRKLCIAYSNTTSGLEIIHGMVDHLMMKLGLIYNDKQNGFFIEPSFDKIFFEDRQAHVFVKGIKAGIFGIVHPKVLKNFNIKNPVTIAEIDIEFIFDLIIKGDLLKGSY